MNYVNQGKNMNDNDFVVKQVTNQDIVSELNTIGFDKSYIEQASDKYKYKNIKIYGLSPAQANIIKQIALSVGTDCAVHRDVITGKIESSDIILAGSYSQLNKIADKLQNQPFSLSKLSEKLRKETKIKKNKTKIVGILNITDNSFSDGGKYIKVQDACQHLDQLIEDGADIIDIGAESTKQNAKPIDSSEQLRRILPVLKYINSSNINIPISIDTRSAIVAKQCLDKGVKIINDVSGLKYDENMAKTISEYGAFVIIQHSAGKDITKKEGKYNYIIDDVFMDLYNQINYAKSYGIKNIITDVGIGFDKNKYDDITLINHIEDFSSLGYPIMLGLSRKSFMGLTDSDNNEKDIYTLALNMVAIMKNVDYIRVHNVKLHRKLLDII